MPIMRCHRAPVLLLLVVLATYVAAQNATPPPPVTGGKAQQEKPSEPKTPPKTIEFSESVAEKILSQVRDGLITHSPNRFLSVFSRELMPGYLRFDDQVRAYFEQYENFRAYFHIQQVSVTDSDAAITADFVVEETARSSGATARRQQQLRFGLQSSDQGWQIVSLEPREFFR